MPKKIKFESFVYRLLAEAECVGRRLPMGERVSWEAFVNSLSFSQDQGQVVVRWSIPSAGQGAWSLNEAEFYLRGDAERFVKIQEERGLMQGADPIQGRNQEHFERILRELSAQAGVSCAIPEACHDRLADEEQFHDDWAAAADLTAIDVVKSNEVCTAPEMRFIRRQLGDLNGKRLLDVGCGLGEASVYFALQGAQVTAMDLSQGMLNSAQKLAAVNGVSIRTHKAAADATHLPEDAVFDVIYAGNLLHHVDIARALDLLKPHVAPRGVMVTWDPIAYNPLINVYRRRATQVRTVDEHPFRMSDIELFRSRFPHVETRHFWLSTLMIFMVMALVQRRDPNRERYWKSVVQEGERWAPLYWPLAALDRVLLALFPPLRWLCWNVVVIARARQDE